MCVCVCFLNQPFSHLTSFLLPPFTRWAIYFFCNCSVRGDNEKPPRNMSVCVSVSVIVLFVTKKMERKRSEREKVVKDRESLFSCVGLFVSSWFRHKVSQVAVAHRFRRVRGGVGIQSGSGGCELLLQMMVVMFLFLANLAQTAVGVAEYLGRVVRARSGCQRARRSHDGRGRLVVVTVVAVMIRAAQVEIAQAEVDRQTQIRHGQRERGKVVAQAAASSAQVAVMIIPAAAVVMVVIHPRVVHARHHGQYLRHFSLELQNLPLASHQQTCNEKEEKQH